MLRVYEGDQVRVCRGDYFSGVGGEFCTSRSYYPTVFVFLPLGNDAGGGSDVLCSFKLVKTFEKVKILMNFQFIDLKFDEFSLTLNVFFFINLNQIFLQ